MKKFKVLIIMIIAFMGAALYNSCEDYTEDYTVPDATMAPEFTITSETLLPGQSIEFHNESVIPKRMGNPTFHWDFGDGELKEVSDIQETQIETDKIIQVSNTLSHTYDTAGTYEVKLLVTTESGDSAEKTETLKITDALVGDTLLYEDFEDSDLMPEDWVLVNRDEGTVASSNPSFQNLTDSAWIVYNSGYFDSNVAMGTSWYEEEVDADDWMILPEVTIEDNTWLTWDAMSLTTSGDYPDSYQVYVSTTTQDIEGCEANGVIYRVTDEEVGVDATNPGDGIQNHRIKLSDDFSGETVYVAFRLMTPYPGGDRLAIDNILMVDIE